MNVITTSTGYFKPGLKAKIVEGGERVVFLGKDCTRVVLPEFTLEFPDGTRKAFCQYGRDFAFPLDPARITNEIEKRPLTSRRPHTGFFRPDSSATRPSDY